MIKASARRLRQGPRRRTLASGSGRTSSDGATLATFLTQASRDERGSEPAPRLSAEGRPRAGDGDPRWRRKPGGPWRGRPNQGVRRLRPDARRCRPRGRGRLNLLDARRSPQSAGNRARKTSQPARIASVLVRLTVARPRAGRPRAAQPPWLDASAAWLAARDSAVPFVASAAARAVAAAGRYIFST